MIAIFGVGALGSHLVPFLRNRLVGDRVYLVDDDRIEAKNTQSQFYGQSQKRLFKTAAIQQTMNLMWPGIKFQASTRRFEPASVDFHFPKDSAITLAVDTFDNGASRRLLQKTVRERKIPCVHAGLDAAGSFALVRWDEDFVADDEPHAGAATCEDGANLPLILWTASTLTIAIDRWLRTGEKVSYAITPAGVVITTVR